MPVFEPVLLRCDYCPAKVYAYRSRGELFRRDLAPLGSWRIDFNGVVTCSEPCHHVKIARWGQSA